MNLKKQIISWKLILPKVKVKIITAITGFFENLTKINKNNAHRNRAKTEFIVSFKLLFSKKSKFESIEYRIVLKIDRVYILLSNVDQYTIVNEW
jgi:hypothetical protein